MVLKTNDRPAQRVEKVHIGDLGCYDHSGHRKCRLALQRGATYAGACEDVCYRLHWAEREYRIGLSFLVSRPVFPSIGRVCRLGLQQSFEDPSNWRPRWLSALGWTLAKCHRDPMQRMFAR